MITAIPISDIDPETGFYIGTLTAGFIGSTFDVNSNAPASWYHSDTEKEMQELIAEYGDFASFDDIPGDLHDYYGYASVSDARNGDWV